MPTKTFFKLNKEKQKRIDDALIKEFTRVGFEKASISNIVRDAKIPRGSFYQYFEDKEDSSTYIINKVLRTEYNKFPIYLAKNNGDIFKTFIMAYEEATKEAYEKEKYTLSKNILIEMRRRNVDMFNYNEREYKKFLPLINKENLDIRGENELFYLAKAMMVLCRNMTLEVVKGTKSIEEGKKQIEDFIVMLKRGVAKKD